MWRDGSTTTTSRCFLVVFAKLYLIPPLALFSFWGEYKVAINRTTVSELINTNGKLLYR